MAHTTFCQAVRPRWITNTVGRLIAHLRRWVADDSGMSTTLGITIILVMLMTAGASIDISNLYRTRTLLQISADTTTHGAMVALARGEDPGTLRSRARDLVMMNLPDQDENRLIADPAVDLQTLHYDPASGKLTRIRQADNLATNAVLLRLQRSEIAGNALPTFLMGMVGRDSWSLATTSVAALIPTRRCSNAEGLVAHGAVTFRQPVALGKGICLHSQTGIALPSSTQTEGDLRLSLPRVDACKGICAEKAKGGPRPVALNLVLPDTATHVQRLAKGFLDPAVTLPEEAAFFSTRPFAGDPEALREVGIITEPRDPGTVIPMTAMQFSQLREHPPGLVYSVGCAIAANPDQPEWQTRITILGREDGPTLKDLVLITDCTIEMDDISRVEGALIILTGGQEHPINALEGATLGDPEAQCNPSLRVRLMATGKLALPAHLARSNLSVVAGGDVLLEEDTSGGGGLHQGLVIHAGGAIVAEGRHEINRCADADDPLLPQMRIIAHVMPALDAVLPAARLLRPETVLPGEAVEAKPGTAVERLQMSGKRM